MYTTEDRNYLTSYLKDTEQRLEQAIVTFSKPQDFKPDAQIWSLEEIVEHLAIVEKSFRRALDYALQQPAISEEEANVQRKSDNYIRKGNAGRAVKVQAPERVVPKGMQDVPTSLAQFKAQRADNSAFINNSTQDFRVHFWTHHFFGPIDAYQICVTMAAHVERHLLQIEELNNL